MTGYGSRTYLHAKLDRDASIRGILTMPGEATAHHIVVYQTHDDACTAADLGELAVVRCAHVAPRAA